VKDLEEDKKRRSLNSLTERPGSFLDKGRVLLWVPNPSSQKFQFSPLTRFTILQKCFRVVSRIVQKFFFLNLKLSGIVVESSIARRSTNLNSEAKQNMRYRKKQMKASSIILAKLFEHIELKMIFELCLKLKRIMLGFFDKLQKFLGEEVSFLDNPIPKINAGSSR
jgi:hypothetical protein